MTFAKHVFVLGLDEHNEWILRNLPDAERYHFHALLSMEEMRSGREIALWDLMDKAVRQLDAFEESIDEYPRFGLVDPERDTAPPLGMSYPMWIKPVKSFSSYLAFGVANQQEFQDALARIRERIGWVGAPFGTVLERLDLPPEIAGVGGRVCLAEETLSGRQLTFEGYRYRGETHTLGVVDSVTPNESPSFVRYQSPPHRAGDRAGTA